MTAVDALRAAWAARVNVGVKRSDLVLRAPAPPPATVLEALKRHKQAIVSLLLRRQLTHWTAADWQASFHERAGISEHDGGLPREEAEALALDHCVAEWLMRQAVQSSPVR